MEVKILSPGRYSITIDQKEHYVVFRQDRKKGRQWVCYEPDDGLAPQAMFDAETLSEIKKDLINIYKVGN